MNHHHGCALHLHLLGLHNANDKHWAWLSSAISGYRACASQLDVIFDKQEDVKRVFTTQCWLAGKRRVNQSPSDDPTSSQQSSGDPASRSGFLNVIRNKVKKLGAPFCVMMQIIAFLQSCVQRRSAVCYAAVLADAVQLDKIGLWAVCAESGCT